MESLAPGVFALVGVVIGAGLPPLINRILSTSDTREERITEIYVLFCTWDGAMGQLANLFLTATMDVKILSNLPQNVSQIDPGKRLESITRAEILAAKYVPELSEKLERIHALAGQIYAIGLAPVLDPSKFEGTAAKLAPIAIERNALAAEIKRDLRLALRPAKPRPLFWRRGTRR